MTDVLPTVATTANLVEPIVFDKYRLVVTDAVTELVLANGSLDLAAERLTRQFKERGVERRPVTPAELLSAITADSTTNDLLARLMRTKMLINSYKAVNIMQEIVLDADNLANSEPQDLIKALEAFSKTFLEMTRQAGGNMFGPNATQISQNVNVFDKVMAVLSETDREALRVLATTPRSQPQLPDTDSAHTE